MYLNAETQSRVLARLHFALAPGGFLFLGKAEMLLSHADLFTPVDLKRRVFSKTPGLGMRQRLAVLAEAGNASAQIQLEVQERVLEAAVESNPSAQIVVDAAGTLVLANHAAQQLFALGPADVGRPLQDLEISYRPLELRSLIEQAYQDGRTIRVADVEKAVRNGDTQYLDVEVTPLRDAQGAAIGVSIAFVDRTERTRVRRELERTREELEHSNEELQSANEELETTNEELQSTNEELETTNEELQSGNEELETMNEELQSTNEELRSLNEQLQVRTQELHEHQSYLEAVLEGLRAAVVVVDPEFRIRSWVEKMQELWGLRREEVLDRSLFELDIGLPVEELRPALEASVRGDGQVPLLEVDAVNRRGASIRCTVTCTPLRQDGVVTGAIVLVQRAVDSLHLSVGEVEGACRSFVEVVQDRSSERSLQRQLRAAASASAAAEERERRRLASDLHDDVGQLLTLAGMKLGALRAAVGGPALEAQLQDVGELVRQAHERTESLTFQLSPPILHDVGLAAAAHWLAEQMQRSYALRVRVESDDEPALDEESRTTLFRALRELLINVARHARVDEACVRIAQADGCVRVVVEDRGAGFDPELEPSGFGLLNVRERLSHMGGRLEIAVVAGDGTRVTLTAPLAAASKEIPG
jgi:PAS domain S-box-containing protein